MTKVHVFGDTGGHFRALRDGLQKIGITDEVPPDHRVIHLGDLVHKGDSSDAVVSLVDRITKNSEGRWIQLMGNHEAMHIAFRAFYPCNCSPETVQTLKAMYLDGRMKVSHFEEFIAPKRWTIGSRPLEQENIVNQLLFTHGGLTRGFWKTHLYYPETAKEASAAINSLSLVEAYKAGEVIDGPPANFNAGPIWAAGAAEVFASWDGHEQFFSQAVGHTAPYNFDRGDWQVQIHKDFRKSSKVLPQQRRIVSFLQDSLIVHMDPDYRKEKPSGPQPSLSFESL